MSLNPITQAKTGIHTDSLAINALNPEQLASFYTESIGLTRIDQADDTYHLGTPDGHVLLSIYQAEQARARTVGLYHMAFLLPTRSDLAELLLHLAERRVPMTGASDHGYSEALYLNDPEGNGIELYADKPVEQWDILESGSITGVVLRLDLDDLVSSAKHAYSGMPLGTTLGHMHLHVADLPGTDKFYRETLGLGLKFPMGKQAIFLASGNYHHHLGANIWQGTNLGRPTQGAQGLRHYTWAANEADYAWIRGRLTETNTAYTEYTDRLEFRDHAGITVYVRKQE